MKLADLPITGGTIVFIASGTLRTKTKTPPVQIGQFSVAPQELSRVAAQSTYTSCRAKDRQHPGNRSSSDPVGWRSAVTSKPPFCSNFIDPSARCPQVTRTDENALQPAGPLRSSNE